MVSSSYKSWTTLWKNGQYNVAEPFYTDWDLCISIAMILVLLARNDEIDKSMQGTVGYHKVSLKSRGFMEH